MSENMMQWLFIKRKKKPSKLLQFFINERKKVWSFLLAFTMVPMIRILSLVMPIPGFSPLQWFLIIAIPLYLAYFILVLQLKIDWRKLAMRLPKAKHLPIELCVIVLAVPCGYIEYLILHPNSIIDTVSWESIVATVSILFIATGLIEEMIFRGLLQNKSMDIFGVWPGIFFISALFAVLHMGHLSFLDVVLAFSIGLVYGVTVKTTRSIIGVSISHTLLNVFLFIVCPMTLI
jgi:hypothetical protein